MALKQVNRSATVAFAPMAHVFAAGTMAGAIDLSFSSSAAIEIFGIDIASGDQGLKLLGSAQTSDRFNRLTWGKFGVDSKAYPYGILAGGLVDGSVNLWDPVKLMSGNPDDASTSLIKKMQAHQGAVRGLEFNIYNPNLLASGAEDGEIKIWNIENPADPTPFAPLRSGGGGEISYLSWNPKVAHILASTSYGGNSVVWDLRKQKQIISFTDPVSRRRCSTLQWNPDIATQLIVASDDDKSPSLQVWDLRNSISPVKELTSHTKGVLAMAWCPHDSGLLLTCAKDNRTLCWDTVSGEVLYELPAGSNWNFDLQWSPCTRGLLSTSSFDGQISLYSIESAGRLANVGDDFAALTNQSALGLARAPQWLKRPCGVSFSFGGKLVSFSQKKTGGSEVKVHGLVTEDELVARSAAFEAAVAGGDKPTLKSFCDTKAGAAETGEEKETWSFLAVLFQEDARTKLLSHLDFQRPEQDGEYQVEASADQLAESLDDKVAIKEAYDAGFQPPAVAVPPPSDPQVGDEDFFDNIHGPITPKTPAGVVPPSTLKPEVAPVEESEEQEEEEEDGLEVEEVEEDPEVEETIQRALVVGNYEGAVDACLAAGRMADALVIASVGGSDLWSKTQNAYMRAIRRPYMKVVECVINNDLYGLIEARPPQQWKETLALLCTYAASEDWASLCDALAAKLEVAGDTQAATLCYICAGNVERTVGIWLQGFPGSDGNHAAVLALQDVMEKAVMLSMASGQRRVSTAMAKLVGEYVELLASQGRLATALDYLTMVPAEESPAELNILRDRIYHSGQVAAGGVSAPHFPFEAQELVSGGGYAAPASYQASAAVPSPYSTPAQAQVYATPAQSRQPSYPTPMAPEPAYSTPSIPQQPMYTVQAPSPAPAAQPQAARWTQGAVQAVPAVPYTAASTPTMFVPKAPPPVAQAEKFQAPPGGPPAYSQRAGPPPTQPSFQPPHGPSVPTQAPPSVPPPTAPPSYPPQQAPPANLMVPSRAAAPRNSTPVSRPPAFVPVAPTSTMPVPAPPSQQPTVPPPGPAPAEPAPTRAPAAPPAPPPTVQTVDTSNVSQELKPVVGTLTRLYQETTDHAGGARAPMAKKREMEDNSKKLGTLFAKLNVGDVSPPVAAKLQHLCHALSTGDFDSAMKIQVGLTATDWDECGTWLVALKRMIKARQSFR